VNANPGTAALRPDDSRDAATESAQGQPLQDAYYLLRQPIYRIRHSEFCVAEEHIHAESVSIRDAECGATVARGVRFLIRSKALAEPQPDEQRRGHDPQVSERFPGSWFDGAQDDSPNRPSAEAFLDLPQISELIAGLGHLLRTADRWSRGDVDSWADLEVVYGWETRLRFGIRHRRREQAAFIESQLEPRIHCIVAVYRLTQLREWLTKVERELKSVS